MKSRKGIKRFTCVGFILCFILFSCGCGEAKPVQTTLTICETQWSELGSYTENPIVCTPLKNGDVVYDLNDTRIVVRKVTENKILLEIDGYMVETNDDGTIDMGIDPLKKIELTSGQSIELAQQSMSAGFNLVISYE